MADYRYLMVANIFWDDKDEEFQKIASFLENCAKDLGMTIDIDEVIEEAYELVAPLELFGFCPYYIESMKRDYVWPYYIDSAAEAYNRRVLVFATAWFLLYDLFDFYKDEDIMRSYYKAFIGQQGEIIDKFKAWEAAAEKLHFDYAFYRKTDLKAVRLYGFHRNPWDKITDNFEPEVMVRILDQYMTLEKKKYILDCMEAFCLIRPQFAYMLDAERPGSIAKYREWIGKEVKFNPYSFKESYANYEKDYMVVHHVDNDGIFGPIAGHYIPYYFFETMSHAIGHWQCDADKPMRDYSNLSWNCFILRQIVFLWNKFNKTQKLPDSKEGFEKIGNEHIDVDIWLSFYALLFVKSDGKDWEILLMQNMRKVLPQTRGWREDQLDCHEGNVFDKIEKAFEEEKKCLTDADFQANLVEWEHLDEKDWAYATCGYKKDNMLIFIKAGRTQVEQWKIAEALEKSYARLVDSDEMYKIKNFNALVDLENIKDEILQGTYLDGAKPIDSEEMYKRLKRKQYEELEKEMERLKTENEGLKESPLETGVKWMGSKSDLLRIIDVLWEMGEIKCDGPEGKNSKKMVFEKLGPAFGENLSNGTQTLSNVESKNNIDNRAALKIFNEMQKKKKELMDEKGAKK